MAILLKDKPRVQLSYGEAQHLFYEDSGAAINTGSLGVNYEIFDLPNLQVLRGYRPRGGKEIPKDLYEDLDEKAKKASSAEEIMNLRMEFRRRVLPYLHK